MTKTVITFRCARSKRELREKFGDNLSRRLNELVEREFAAAPARDWGQILDRPAERISRKAFQRCLIPE